MFKRLELGGWRQFDTVEVNFHPRLTVITGANGAGKSTLLSVLTRHLGWHRPFLSVPTSLREESTRSYFSGVFKELLRRFSYHAERPHSIGSVTYQQGSTAYFNVHDNPGSYESAFSIDGQQPVYGLYIDSHRPAPTYSQISHISMTPMTAAQSFNTYNSELLQRYSNAQYSGVSPIFRMKESIISMAVFGEGNATLGGANEEIRALFSGFNEILRKILPPSLGFREIVVRAPDVVLMTETGPFMLDAASGGIMTLIDIAWRIYLFAKSHSDFVVVMDEPENHLHPAMQRTLMSRLIDAFPRAQFIIATHSPFMVTSVKDSSVYVLRYRQSETQVAADVPISLGRRVFSEPLPTLNKASSAADILTEVLGVPATMPEWVERDLERIVTKHQISEFSNATLNELRRDLSSIGFESYFPEAVAKIVKRK